MLISLEKGVPTAVLGLAGAGAVVMWPEQWIVGAALVAAAALLLIWGIKIEGRHWWDKKPSGYRLTDTNLASLERIMGGDDWMPLHKALRYLVYQSHWADKQPAAKDEEDFDRIVGAEIRERLARGEIAARGKLGLDKGALHRAIEPISADFWVNAFLQPHGEIVLADDERSVASTVGGSGSAYRGIIFRKSDVEAVWPKRGGKETTLLASCVENERAKYEAARASSSQLQPSTKAILAAMIDEVDGHEAEARLRLAALVPVHKVTKKLGLRDTTLSEALAYAVYGQWGKTYSDAILAGNVEHGEIAEQFRQMAFDGELPVWGKLSNSGLFQPIPKEYWRDHQIRLTDVISPGLDGGAHPYRHLMLNRAKVEMVWPHEG